MSIEYRIDPENRRISISIVGDFAFSEAVDVLKRVTTSPDFEPGFDILSDHTQIGRAIGVEEAKDLVAMLRPLADRLRGTRWAVATSRIDSFGMMRMLSGLAESIPLEIRAFHNMEEAEAWLNSRPPA
jgi:hypothetical protein